MTVIADIPLAYAYINFCLGALVSETGWENLTYIFLTEEVWRIMGITVEPTAPEDLKQYYALLKFKALEHFRDELSTSYDYKADGESFNRSQMFEQVGKLATQAKMDALPYLIGIGQIETGRMTYSDDPYSIDGQIAHNA
jgi:hypothetical protein